MNKKLLIVVMIVFTWMNTYSFALGYNVSFAFDGGITEALWGEKVERNINFWEDTQNFSNYISFGGLLSADVVFTNKLSLEAGAEYKNLKLNYVTKDDNLLSNGNVNLNFSVVQVPVFIKYTIPLKKTTEVVNSINIAIGANVSCVLGKQSYFDELTKYVGRYVSPPINVGASLKVCYSHRLGPGNFYAGVKGDIGILQQGYKISGRSFSFGNTLNVTPLFGYSFILKEDKKQAKVTEKNKRIKDIDVF